MVAHSFIDGCAIDGDRLFVAQIRDADEPYAPHTRLSVFDGRSATRKLARDTDRRMLSLCIWRDSPFGNDALAALSLDGAVEIVGPGARVPTIEYVAGDGPIPPGRGWMYGLTQVGTRLYACGGSFRAFRRDRDGWHDISSPDDAGESMAHGQRCFHIGGNGEDDLYALGLDGVNRNRISHFDGRRWRVVEARIDGLLTAMHVARDGTVWAGGSDGRLFCGDAARGFSASGVTGAPGCITSLETFAGHVYVASTSGLFRTAGLGAPIEPVDTGLAPKESRPNRLSVADGVLWAVCRKAPIRFDGRSWTRPRARRPSE